MGSVCGSSRSAVVLLRVKAGSLFPAFRHLERDGDIAAEWRVTENGRRAKYYSLTNRGRETLAQTTWEWRRQTTAISRVLKASLEEL